MSKETVYLASKPRYEILDGLRGVAAVMVVLYHLLETYITTRADQVINHGYLAVDFFFLLSGFVIGYAYDDRWDKMTTWGFFKRRLARLHPMVIFGTVFGACVFFLGSYPGFSKMLTTPGWKFFLAFFMGILMIPCGPKMDIRGWSETNSFNGANWTLTFEYIGNILYAFILRRLPKIVLGILCLVCIFFTLDLTMGWDVFGLSPFREVVLADGTTAIKGGPAYNVVGGWSLTAKQMYIGFTRLGYPFLCGILLSRIGKFIKVRGGFWWCALALAVIFCIPCVGGHQGIADGLFQAVSIIILFPLILLMGAGSKTTDVKSTAICKFLGDISYPIYITHYPLIYLQIAWVKSNMDAPTWMHITFNAGIFILAMILSYAAFKLYDLPVREWLKVHWLHRSQVK